MSKSNLTSVWYREKDENEDMPRKPRSNRLENMSRGKHNKRSIFVGMLQ